MPRRNTPTHGRRLPAEPPAPVRKTHRVTPDEMARRLVDSGLATQAILDTELHRQREDAT